MVDIPGCYSLMAHSSEEEVARDFICFENPDAVIVVCDATCLERNLNLVLQILEEMCIRDSVAVLVLFYGVGHWNAYFNAMIYLHDKALYPPVSYTHLFQHSIPPYAPS